MIKFIKTLLKNYDTLRLLAFISFSYLIISIVRNVGFRMDYVVPALLLFLSGIFLFNLIFDDVAKMWIGSGIIAIKIWDIEPSTKIICRKIKSLGKGYDIIGEKLEALWEQGKFELPSFRIKAEEHANGLTRKKIWTYWEKEVYYREVDDHEKEGLLYSDFILHFVRDIPEGIDHEMRLHISNRLKIALEAPVYNPEDFYTVETLYEEDIDFPFWHWKSWLPETHDKYMPPSDEMLNFEQKYFKQQKPFHMDIQHKCGYVREYSNWIKNKESREEYRSKDCISWKLQFVDLGALLQQNPNLKNI